METITLIYKRLPDRINHFQQQLLYADEEVMVTSQRIKPSSPIVQNGENVLGENFTAVWFVFTGLWYDIGKIYNLNNEWTGYYCDIMMPVKRPYLETPRIRSGNSSNSLHQEFEITDLFLDLWINPDGSYEIQDEDEFEAAVQDGVINTELAEKARDALNTLIVEVAAEKFPPQFVRKYRIPA